MNSIRDTVEFYNNEADQYDTSRYKSESGRLWNQLQFSTVRNLLHLTGLQEPKIMDLACGTGRFAIELATSASHVYAVDQSDRMLEITRSKCESKDLLAKFTFVKSDVGLINIESNTVELALLMNAVSHLPHLLKAFSEVSRVLEPDGYFLFNYPNLNSLYYPLGFWITRRKRALLKEVYTRWLKPKEIDWLLSTNNLEMIDSRGLLLPTVFPLPKIYNTSVFGRDFNNKAIVRLCPLVFVLARTR